MYPAPFAFVSASSLEDAVVALHEHGPDARVLAGGQSLIPLMKLRLARPAVLVDINHVQSLDTVDAANGSLRLGTLVRYRDLVAAEPVRRRVPLLAEAASRIADVQVRNWGTVGGALAEADPSGDLCAAAIALDARVHAVGPAGRRSMPAREFFVDTFTTGLAGDEVIEAIEIPFPHGRTGGAYEKLVRREGDYAVCAVAVQLTVDDEGRCTDAGVGLAAMGATPLRARAAESALRGEPLSAAALDAAAEVVADGTDPGEDVRGSAAYRRSVVRTVFRRAAARAAAAAKGGA